MFQKTSRLLNKCIHKRVRINSTFTLIPPKIHIQRTYNQFKAIVAPDPDKSPYIPQHSTAAALQSPQFVIDKGLELRAPPDHSLSSSRRSLSTKKAARYRTYTHARARATPEEEVIIDRVGNDWRE